MDALTNEGVVTLIVGIAVPAVLLLVAIMVARPRRHEGPGPTGTKKDPACSHDCSELPTETYAREQAAQLRAEVYGSSQDSSEELQACVRCGGSNPPDSTFCEQCGAALDQRRIRHQMGWRHGPIVLGVGRMPHNTIVLANDGMVSSEHAQFWFSGGTLMVRDLGSTNGTYLNGVRIFDKTMVIPGDEIRFGRTLVRFDVLLSALAGEMARLTMDRMEKHNDEEVH